MKNKTPLPCILLALIAAACFSCKREFDTPPIKHIADGSKINIRNLKSRFDANSVYKFSGDTNLYCVVIADELSGNLYKDVYVRDATGAIHVKLTESGGLFTGDSIRINLNNVLLNHYADLVQLDSVSTEKNVVKLASGLTPQPEEMSLEKVTDPVNAGAMQSKLVKISNVQFSDGGRNQPFANATSKAAGQYTVQDCKGNKAAVRTSGYAYYANRLTPGGNGSMIAIVSRYYSSVQLLIRSPEELNMSGSLCATSNPTSTPNPTTAATYLIKDFNDNSVTSAGWSTYNVMGSIHWSTSTKGGAPNAYCQISNYVSGSSIACETWLISPPLGIASSTNPVLSFRNASNYTGPVLGLYVSTDYSGGSPASANWTALTFTASTGGFTFVHSGSIPLSAFKSSTTRFAFKYTGTGSSGATWEVDDIEVKEN